MIPSVRNLPSSRERRGLDKTGRLFREWLHIKCIMGHRENLIRSLSEYTLQNRQELKGSLLNLSGAMRYLINTQCNE